MEIIGFHSIDQSINQSFTFIYPRNGQCAKKLVQNKRSKGVKVGPPWTKISGSNPAIFFDRLQSSHIPYSDRLQNLPLFVVYDYFVPPISLCLSLSEYVTKTVHDTCKPDIHVRHHCFQNSVLHVLLSAENSF